MMVKVLGNLIAMSPPLIITREEIDKVIKNKSQHNLSPSFLVADESNVVMS